MIRLLHSLAIKADAWPPRGLLLANLGLAVFVVLAHGGALLASSSQPTSHAGQIKAMAAFSLPIAGSVLLTALLGLIVPRARTQALAFHGAVLFLGAISLVACGMYVVIHGVPSNERFTWSTGLFSLTVSYSVFIFSRHTLPKSVRAWPTVFYLPFAALLFAAIVEVGVLYQFARTVSAQFPG